MGLFGFGKSSASVGLFVVIPLAVGVLTEVPVMLALCRFANKTKGWFQ